MRRVFVCACVCNGEHTHTHRLEICLNRLRATSIVWVCSANVRKPEFFLSSPTHWLWVEPRNVLKSFMCVPCFHVQLSPNLQLFQFPSLFCSRFVSHHLVALLTFCFAHTHRFAPFIICKYSYFLVCQFCVFVRLVAISFLCADSISKSCYLINSNL